MSLADHWSEHNYFGVGDHQVTVTGFRLFDCKSGNSGVEFTLEARGKTTKVSFILTDTSLWVLASFARACGITEEQARGYDPFAPQSHRMLVNKCVCVRVVKVGKYHEVDKDNQAWWLFDGESPAYSDPEPVAAPATEETETKPPDDDIPF